MMGRTYPIHLKIEHLLCVVIGGGQVAARKIRSLLAGGAKVTVVSPSVVEEIQSLAQANRVEWRRKNFSPEDLRGANLVFACTNDRETNEEVARSLQPGQWVNVADRPDLSTFFVPAHFRRGMVTVSVATDGASPGLARKIKEKLQDVVDEAYGPYGEFLAFCRQMILEKIKSEEKRRELFYALLEDEYLAAFRRQEGDRAMARFMKRIEEAAEEEGC